MVWGVTTWGTVSKGCSIRSLLPWKVPSPFASLSSCINYPHQSACLHVALGFLCKKQIPPNYFMQKKSLWQNIVGTATELDSRKTWRIEPRRSRWSYWLDTQLFGHHLGRAPLSTAAASWHLKQLAGHLNTGPTSTSTKASPLGSQCLVTACWSRTIICASVPAKCSS